MKISKTALLALSGALSIAGLGLMFVSAEKNVILNIDPSNAVQHIETVKFISGSTDGTATLQQVGNSLVGIDTNNFTLSKEGGDQNTNNGNLGSSILGGIKNTLVGSYNVILGGEGNNINDGMNNVILGGNGNTIKGGKNYSTIVGGKGNTINESISSVIVGGWKNDIAKKTTNDGYSVVVGSNSSVKGNNSTALGVESKVDANNSFLWTDRDHNGTLSADGAFAVVGKNGMVIGTNQAHSFAQLTLNGGLVIRKGDSNLECNHSNGGSLRVVDAPSGDGRVCLCSCDGYSWNSMFGLGQCKLACDSRYNPPVCGTKVVKICGDGDMNIYSGSCEKGEVVEGDGAYLVTKDNMVHWSCQTDDALVVNCVGVALDEGCNVHGVARPCKGTRPGEGQMYKFGDGGYLPGHTPNRWTRVEDTKEPEACEWRCNSESGYLWNGTMCVLTSYDCGGVKPTGNGYIFGETRYLYGTTPNTWGYTGSLTPGQCQYTCDTNYTWNGSSCVANACQGTLPDHATLWNSALPSNNTTNYSYSATTTTAACKFKCDTNYTWNATTKMCVANERLGDCTGLPTYAEWVNGKFKQTWNGTSWTPATKIAVFSTDSSVECSFKCKTNYTYNTTSKTCVANTQQKNCTGKPDNSYWVNDKFKQTWNGSAWTPATKAATYSSSSSVECSFQCNENYTWNSITQTCVANGHLGDCTGLPAHAEWVNGKFQQTWNGSAWVPTTKAATFSTDGSVECSFKCKTNYTYNTTSKACVADTQQKNCTGKPDNSYWVNDKFQQTWNGTSWTPATKDATYSSSSSVECSFQCNQNYTYNTTSKTCEANTQQKNCTGKPDNSYWVNGKFQQTWNGSAWTPATKAATYSSSSSVECSFQCNQNYTYNTTSKTCEANTQTANCGGSIPTGAEKKTGHGTYTQTWDGTSWTPTKSWSYNADVCGYLCDTANGYKWNTTVSMCVKCQGTLPSNTTLWNSSALPSNNTTNYEYSATSTTAACKFKCINTSYTWNGSACVPAQKLTVRFYANGNKIPVAQNAYEENYIELQCTVGSNGTCDITSPSITAATNTPTVIGWSTAADRHESDWAPGTKKTISSDGTYYAQTKKNGKTLNATFEPNGNRFQVYTNTYTTDNIVKNCTIPTVYNGSTQATSCNVISPTIAGLTDSRIIIGFSSSAISHTNEWSPNTSKAISSDVTYYAQTKKDAQVKVTFRANGNKVQNDQGVFVSDDVIKTCSRGMYYNGSTNLGSLNPTCSITSPYITATTSTPTVIGWSTAADRHEKDWTVGASLGLSASHVEYFAQTKETRTLKIKLEKDDTVSSISESGEKTLCTVNRYNGGDRTPSTCSKTFPTCTYDSQSGCHESCRFYIGSTTYVPGQGYSFNVWDDASYVPVYTAKAPLKKFTITYNPNGGKWSDGSISNKISNDVNCGNITLEAAPTKDNNDFIGWYTALEGGTYVGMGSENYALKQDVTLYAHWSPKSYSCGVSVNSCGGSVTATNSDENDSKWRWYCGTKYCYKCKGGYNDQGGGVCSEPTEDGECNFDNGKCSAGTYEYLNNIGDSTSDVKGIKWRCNGKGNGQSHTCTLRWNCNGSCSADTSDCAGMYVGTNAPKTRTDCYNAGMYVLYKRNGAYGVATSEIYNKDTCYLSSPVAGYESDNSCGEESSNYINNPNAIFGYSRSCMKWTPTVKCEQLVDSGSPTSVSTTKCDNVLSSKPMTCTSTSSWGGPGGNSNVGGAKCYYKAGTSHARGCAAVYPNGTTPYNGTNWISGSDNTAGWISYCSNQKSQTACEAVKVASFCAANCGSSGSPVHQYNLPGSNGPANVIISDCCEWR